MKKWAAALAIALLGADIIGRILLVITGLYPTETMKNLLSMVTGTTIVAVLTMYIVLSRKSFGSINRAVPQSLQIELIGAQVSW